MKILVDLKNMLKNAEENKKRHAVGSDQYAYWSGKITAYTEIIQKINHD